MNNYYQILGLTPNATREQIKKAYRRKAKLFHPDINKASDAKEQFILINEAYEFLLRTSGKAANHIKRAREQAQKQAAYQQEWEQQERQKARERARAYAQMKYEAYLKSDIYKTTEVLNVIADFFGTIVGLLFFIGLPVFSYMQYGPISLIFFAIIVLPTSPLWFRFFVQTFSNLNIETLYKKDKITIHTKALYLILFCVFNIYIFFQVTLNTLIKLQWVSIIYGCAMITGYLLTTKIYSRFYKYLIRLGCSPGIISLVFLTNYLCAFSPKTESYRYTYSYHNPSPIFTTIILEENAYLEYPGIRMFVIGEKVLDHSLITYKIKKGILGFEVIKSIQIE